MRVSELRAGLRHIPACLQADVRREGVHAAARAAADRRLHAGRLAGPLRRREHQRGDGCRTSPGPTWCSSPACTSRSSRSATSSAAPRPPARSRCSAGRRSRLARRCIRTTTICTSARSATPPTPSSRSLDATPRRRRRTGHFTTKDRLPLTEFPIPAYDLIPFGRYLLGSCSSLSGCPYLCEFCDIPGALRPPAADEDAAADPRRARLHFLAAGDRRPVYFVDDNFIGNRKAAKEILPHLVDWQKRARLSGDVRLRGDAEHRQADRHSRADEGGRLRQHVLSASRRRSRRARRDAKAHNNAVPMLDSIRR